MGGSGDTDGRQIVVNRNTAISLGLALSMLGGAIGILLWVKAMLPSANDIKVIVRDENKPIAEAQEENSRAITRIEGKLETLQVQLDALKAKVQP